MSDSCCQGNRYGLWLALLAAAVLLAMAFLQFRPTEPIPPQPQRRSHVVD